MSTTMSSASSSRPPERRVDDVRRAVQPLRRAEHLAPEAVGDHHVVADGHAEHRSLLSSVGDDVWQSAGSVPPASRAITSGSSSKRDSPVSSASKAGSRSRSRASASRSAVVRRAAPGRRDRADLAGADAEPAGVEGAAQRQLHLAVAVPAEVDDRALRREQVQRRAAARRTSRWRARRGRGRRRASSGRAKRDAERRRDLGPAGSTSTRVTSTPGKPGEQPRDAAADHAGADDRDPVAEQRRRVPQRVDRGLDRAGEHRPCGRHVVGHDGTASAGTT